MWIKKPPVCLRVWIFEWQSNRQRMSQVSPLRWNLPGWHPRGKSSRFQTRQEMCSKCNTCWYCMYRYIEFCFIQFWSIFSLLPLSSPSPPSLSPSPTSPLGFPLCDADGSCLFPDAQTLFNVSLNNSALMEIFNIACWSPLGAVDGLLFEIGVYIYESWPDGAEERACNGVNKWKTELEKEAKIKKKNSESSNCACIAE